MAVGMAEYRSGNNAAAEEEACRRGGGWPEQPLGARHFGILPGDEPVPAGKKVEARKLATEAVAKMKPLPEDEKHPLSGGANHDDLMLWLAYKEAMAMIRDN